MALDTITVRPLHRTDTAAIWHLRCNPDVDKYSLGSPPSWDEHKQYIEDYIESKGTYFVAECNGLFAGYASASPRFGVVNIAVVAAYRGLGIGSKLLQSLQAERRFLEATVHEDNTASICLFTKNDFERLDYNDPWIRYGWRREQEDATT